MCTCILLCVCACVCVCVCVCVNRPRAVSAASSDSASEGAFEQEVSFVYYYKCLLVDPQLLVGGTCTCMCVYRISSYKPGLYFL